MTVFSLLIDNKIFEILFKKSAILFNLDYFFWVALFSRESFPRLILSKTHFDVFRYFAFLPLIRQKVDRPHHIPNGHLFLLNSLSLPLKIFPNRLLLVFHLSEGLLLPGHPQRMALTLVLLNFLSNLTDNPALIILIHPLDSGRQINQVRHNSALLKIGLTAPGR